MAKNIAWDILKKSSLVVPGVEYNEAELTARYPNGSKITLYGSDNPDSLRGIGLWGVVFDEYSQQPSNIFSEIISPALSDHRGYAIWIGTPKGHNDFYRLYEKAKADPDWFSFVLSADSSGILPVEELAVQRKNMTQEEYDQEYLCSFEAAIKGAYYAKELSLARAEGRITSVPHDRKLPVYTWWDLGIGDATAIIFVQKTEFQWRIIDAYQASGEALHHYARVLQERGYNYATHYAPHDIEVRELGSGTSRKEIAASIGLNFEVAPKLPVEDGINAVRMAFNKLWFDETKCATLLDALSLYRKEWDDAKGDFRMKPTHDWTSHYSDAVRYMAVTDTDGLSNKTYIYRPKVI